MHDHGNHARGGHFRYCLRRTTCLCESLRYFYALVIALVIAAVEIVGWHLSGSIALFGDIGHVLSDAAGLGFALALSIYIRKKVSRKRRTLRIAGFAFQLILLGCTIGWVAIENTSRLFNPPEVVPIPLIVAASIGMFGNALQLWVLKELENLNALAAWWHALFDLGLSVVVLIGGLVLWSTGYAKADPIAAIAVIILLFLHIIFVFRKSTRRKEKRVQ